MSLEIWKRPSERLSTIMKAKYYYDQNKGKPDHHKAWKEKKNEKFGQINK